MPPLDPATDAVVTHHWTRAVARTNLFNGRVFCADTITPTLILGHWTEYRRVIAQMAEPALFATLQVRSLAVCGLLDSPDGAVIGRREPASAYQPGLWQFAPAGSVDQGAAKPGGVSWRHALLTELQEELGIPPDAVAVMDPVCLVQHPTGVLDMGVRLQTRLTAAEIIDLHHTRGNGEYDRLLVCPTARLIADVQAKGGTLVPASRLFLATF